MVVFVLAMAILTLAWIYRWMEGSRLPMGYGKFDSKLAYAVLRELDAVQACIGALEVAVEKKDLGRIATLQVQYCQSLVHAEAAVECLEAAQKTKETEARAAIARCRERAANLLALAESLLLEAAMGGGDHGSGCEFN